MAKSGEGLDECNGVVVKMNTPESFDALQYHQFGNPVDVLKLEKKFLMKAAPTPKVTANIIENNP